MILWKLTSKYQQLPKPKNRHEIIARHLVEAKLAACVQIVGPITSIYHWKGKVENAGKWLCLIKNS